MEEDLEDGEVVESEEEKSVCVSNNALSMPTVNGLNGKESLLRSGTNIKKQNMSSARSKLPRNLSSSEDSDGGSTHSLTSEDEAGPVKRKPIVGDLQPSALTNANLSSGDGKAKRARTKNNIWGTVLNEQTLSKEVGSWGVNRNFESDRDVESYDYLKAQEMAAAYREQGQTPFEDSDDNNEEVSTDLCDIETFGAGVTRPKPLADPDILRGTQPQDGQSTSDRKIWRKRTHGQSLAGRLGVRVDDASPADDAPGNDDTHTVQSIADMKKVLEAMQSRLGPRGYDETKDRSHIGVNSSDTPLAVTDAIMRILKEPPHMKGTFTKVVETIGAEQALTLLYKTEDLEEAGGIMTFDGTRRRTAGGVYIYLLKNDHPKKVTNVIFSANMKQQFHAKKAREKREKCWAAERRPKSPVAELPDCKDVFLKSAGDEHRMHDDSMTEKCPEPVGSDNAEVMEDMENDISVAVDFA